MDPRLGLGLTLPAMIRRRCTTGHRCLVCRFTFRLDALLDVHLRAPAVDVEGDEHAPQVEATLAKHLLLVRLGRGARLGAPLALFSCEELALEGERSCFRPVAAVRRIGAWGLL
eukprot:16440890-Heterocapsa_arctica.AAC.3